MDLKELKLFCHLATSLHFGRTAEAMHVSAPTLSRVVQRLEKEVGEQLLLRDNRQVALTAAGQSFLRFAHRVMDDWQVLGQSLQREPSELKGELSIYCSVTASYGYLLDILKPFRQRYPGIDIKLETGDAAWAVPKVRDGEVEIAIAARPDKLPAGVQFHDFAEAPLRLIAPKLACPVRSSILEHPIDWGSVPFILAEHGVARDRVVQWFRQLAVKPHIHAQVSGHEAIVSMVALGFGVGAVPQPVLDHSPLVNQIHVISDQAPFAPFTVGICARDRYLSDPRLAAFWQMALVVFKGSA